MSFTEKFIKEFKNKQNNTFEDNINKSRDEQNAKIEKLERQIFNILKLMVDNRELKPIEEVKFKECSKKIAKFICSNFNFK
jgi:hypothetical protein